MAYMTTMPSAVFMNTIHTYITFDLTADEMYEETMRLYPSAYFTDDFQDLRPVVEFISDEKAAAMAGRTPSVWEFFRMEHHDHVQLQPF